MSKGVGALYPDVFRHATVVAVTRHGSRSGREGTSAEVRCARSMSPVAPTPGRLRDTASGPHTTDG